MIGRAAARGLAADGWRSWRCRAPAGCRRLAESASTRSSPTERTTHSCGRRSDPARRRLRQRRHESPARRAAQRPRRPRRLPRRHLDRLGLRRRRRTALDGEGGEPPQLPVRFSRRSGRRSPGTPHTRRRRRARADAAARSLPATLIVPAPSTDRGREPRELFFVKRAVDGRRRVALAWRGESRFNTASVANLAELIRLAARSRATASSTAAIGSALDTRDLPRDRRRARPRVRAGSAPGGRVRQPVGRPVFVAARRLDGGRGARARYRPATTYPEAVKRRAPGSSASSSVAAAGRARTSGVPRLRGEDEVLAAQS